MGQRYSVVTVSYTHLAASRVGKSRSAVANALRLLSLTPPVAKLVEEGKLSAGHALSLIHILDEADALRMLTALQGRRHTVCTGVTVCRGSEILTESESTDVYFRPATEAELRGYIRTGEPMDKAGAYGVQGLGADVYKRQTQ